MLTIYVIIVVIAVKCAVSNISITTSVVLDTEIGPKDDVRT